MLWRFCARILLLLAAFCALAVSLPAKKKPPAAPVNLNTATSEELQLVPGIGPVTAEKILQMRKSYGAFKSVDDLSAIRGIGPKRLEKMRKYLTVGKPVPRRPAAPDAKCPHCAKEKTPSNDSTPAVPCPPATSSPPDRR